MSTATRRERQGSAGGGGVRQFPVGRRRYVPVVDAGCGDCRPPRRPRMIGLPSLTFLKSSDCRLGGGGAETAVVVRGGRAKYFSASSSASTAPSASLSSSCSCGATHSSAVCSSAYSDEYHYYGGAAATTKTKPAAHKAAEATASSARKKKDPAPTKKKQAQKQKQSRHDEDEDALDSGVGVAVEKESRDPRADFRDSMVQMVVETGLRDWEGLRRMVRRLLALNAPRHHAAILAAFADLCAQIVAAPAGAHQLPSPSPSPSPPH